MRLGVSRLPFDLARRRAAISMSDVEKINRDTLRELERLSKEQLTSRLTSVNVQEKDGYIDWNRALELLRDEGIFILPGFIETEEARKTAEEAEAAIDMYCFHLENDSHEDGKALIQRASTVVGGYANLVNYPKPVIQIRQGHDEGMIDVFNADRLLGSETAALVRKRFSDERLLSVFEKYQGTKIVPRNLNVYINKGVGRTRGFHVDSYGGHQLKAFVYLTDVVTLDDGPYTYVKGSHRDESYQKINRHVSSRLKDKTEAPVINSSAVIPVLAKAGTLVVSDQGGIHRGLPQGDEARRIVAVMNYGKN